MERTLPDFDSHGEAALRGYTLAKQQVAAAVRATKQLFQAHDAREATDRCQELLVQLAEDRFNLAVVGQFKRGKSTLMNAILGRDLLPTGLLPLTSAITTLCYGSTERVLLRRAGWTLKQEISLAELPAFITERGNPGNEKGLIEARVELPLPFLRRGLHFIDTPGIGSARHENTATTYGFLPQVTAVIFVTSVEAPFSEAEEAFLIDIRGQVRQVFVVVNKMDMLGGTDRDEVLGYIQTRVNQLLGTQDAYMAPLSARDGLIAKLNHDDAGIQGSGLASFEQVLATFLAEAQGRTFLVSILDRTLHLLTSAEPMLTSAPVDGRLMPPVSAPDLRQTLQLLRESLLAKSSLPGVFQGAEPVVTEPRIIEQAIAASRTPVRERREGQSQTRTSTCPICTAQAQALFAFFAKWQYTLATDTAAQHAFAAERGFCPVHTWQFQEMASPQGISDGYAPLIETLAVQLARLLDHPPEHPATSLSAFIANPATCPACRVVREAADEQIDHLLASLITAEGREDYTVSTGLCLPHLQETLARVEATSVDGTGEGRTVSAFLLREQMQRLENLAEDLRSYTLKRDALRRGLLNREEANAWRRALVQLVGERAARGGATMADQATV